jgi:cytochrome P450/NADPH-cytochrome P450 reductase
LDRATTDDAKILGGVQYAVFGLGNKNWRTYQAFPNKVDKYLEELGAERIFPPGSGDADKDIDGDFNRWCYYFWQSLSCVLKLDPIPGASIIPTAAVDNDSFAQVSVKFIPPTDSEKWKLANENKNGEYNAKVLTNRELQTETSDRSTRHIEIDVSKLDSIGETHLYDAGDHLEIMPENKLSDAEAIALGFGLILDSVFEIDPESIEGVSPRSLAASIKGPCTVRNTLVYYADILSPPSRRMLGKFAEQLRSVAPETADIFDKLTMPDENNVDQYPTFIEKHRTLLDLQRAFPQVNRLDLGQFLATVGVMQPRRYSIASSPLAHPTVAHITVGVVDDVIEGRHYPGLASSYLLRLKDEGNTLRAKFKSSKSTFSLPQNIEAPLVMVAAGTGVSPFRGFLQERAYQREQGQKVGPCILFFGCRHPEQDYIYREELDKYVQSGLLQSYTAFSRLVPTPARKYVQHQLLANAADVWNVVAESKGVVYVCGAGAMSQEVRSTFETMTKSFGVAQSDEEARDYIGQLLDNSLYREDVWG